MAALAIMIIVNAATFSAQPAVFDIDIVYFQLENQSLAGIGRPEDWIYKRRIGHTEHDLVCCINSVLEHHETLNLLFDSKAEMRTIKGFALCEFCRVHLN